MSQPSPLQTEVLAQPEPAYKCEDDTCTLTAVVEISYSDEDQESYYGLHCQPHADQRESELAADGIAYRLELAH